MENLTSAISSASELIKSQKYDEAISDLKSLQETEPENELVLGMLASVYSEIKLFDKAIQLFEKILEINPANPLARFQLGMNFFQTNEFEKALQIWAPALQDKNDFMSHYVSGLALLQTGKSEQAMELLNQALDVTPKDHPVYEELITLLENLSKETLN